MCSNCSQHRNQCCCHTRFETEQVRRLLDVDDLIRLNEERRRGRLFEDRINQCGSSSINRFRRGLDQVR